MALNIDIITKLANAVGQLGILVARSRRLLNFNLFVSASGLLLLFLWCGMNQCPNIVLYCRITNSAVLRWTSCTLS